MNPNLIFFFFFFLAGGGGGGVALESLKIKKNIIFYDGDIK